MLRTNHTHPPTIAFCIMRIRGSTQTDPATSANDTSKAKHLHQALQVPSQASLAIRRHPPTQWFRKGYFENDGSTRNFGPVPQSQPAGGDFFGNSMKMVDFHNFRG
jgi:hypothetical protein